PRVYQQLHRDGGALRRGWRAPHLRGRGVLRRYTVAVANMATAAAPMTVAVAHPSQRSMGGLVRSPITRASLVRSTIITMSGGARTPFSTADQNSIATASKPA